MDALNKTLCETFNDEESGDSVEISDLSIELEESDIDENPMLWGYNHTGLSQTCLQMKIIVLQVLT